MTAADKFKVGDIVRPIKSLRYDGGWHPFDETVEGFEVISSERTYVVDEFFVDSHGETVITVHANGWMDVIHRGLPVIHRGLPPEEFILVSDEMKSSRVSVALEDLQ